MRQFAVFAAQFADFVVTLHMTCVRFCRFSLTPNYLDKKVLISNLPKKPDYHRNGVLNGCH